jgi:hypothetical protein
MTVLSPCMDNKQTPGREGLTTMMLSLFISSAHPWMVLDDRLKVNRVCSYLAYCNTLYRRHVQRTDFAAQASRRVHPQVEVQNTVRRSHYQKNKWTDDTSFAIFSQLHRCFDSSFVRNILIRLINSFTSPRSFRTGIVVPCQTTKIAVMRSL